MATFKMGQPVRVVETSRGRNDPQFVGMEAVVVRGDIPVRNSTTGEQHPDGVEIYLAIGVLALVLPHWIEPITKPGQETADWSKSLCRPDGSYNPSGDHIPVMTPEWVSAWGGR